MIHVGGMMRTLTVVELAGSAWPAVLTTDDAHVAWPTACCPPLMPMPMSCALLPPGSIARVGLESTGTSYHYPEPAATKKRKRKSFR